MDPATSLPGCVPPPAVHQCSPEVDFVVKLSPSERTLTDAFGNKGLGKLNTNRLAQAPVSLEFKSFFYIFPLTKSRGIISCIATESEQVQSVDSCEKQIN